jgi:hypothetical protein
MIPVEEYEALRRQVEEHGNFMQERNTIRAQLHELKDQLADVQDDLTTAYMAGHAKGADQLAAMTQERDHYKEMDALHIQSIGLKSEQLAAAQADNARLRECLERYCDDKCNAEYNPCEARKALATQPDHYLRQLEAAQADNARLREALEEAMYSNSTDVARQKYDDALTTQPDHAALDARLKEERERCAKILDAASGTGKIVSCVTAAKAIRSLT